MSMPVADVLHSAIVHAVDDMSVDVEYQPPSEVEQGPCGVEDSSSAGLSSRSTKIPRLEEPPSTTSASSLNGESISAPSSCIPSSDSVAMPSSISALRLRPRLPPEILDTVLAFLKPKNLHPVLLTNSFLGAIAQRRFYASVTLDTPARTVSFLQTVLRNPRLPPMVRSLDVDVSRQGAVRNGAWRRGLRAMVGEATALVSGVGAALGTALGGHASVNPLQPAAAAATGVAAQAPAAAAPPPPTGPPPGPPPPPPASPPQPTLDGPIGIGGVAHPTANLYRLLQRALRRMPALVALSLELPKAHSPVWLFEGCPFRLKRLTTSMHCRRPLARFLGTRTVQGVEELTLRGFQSDSVFFLPFVDSGAAAAAAGGGTGAGAGGGGGGNVSGDSEPGAEDDEDPEDESTFRLAPSALPRLRMFSAIHAGPPIVHTVMATRPVEIVSVPLFPHTGLATLDALAMGSALLRRLNVISFDPGAPSFLFEHLARRFGGLEALHVVMLMADYSKQFLEDCAMFLCRFKNLKYITFMAASQDDALALLDEDDIAKRWHQACPTLRTIILPRGRVWFQGEPEPGKRTGQEIVRLGSPLR